MGMTQVDQTVSFLQGPNPQVREEKGPTLYDVLSSAAPELTSSGGRHALTRASSEGRACHASSRGTSSTPHAALNNRRISSTFSLGEAVRLPPPGRRSPLRRRCRHPTPGCGCGARDGVEAPLRWRPDRHRVPRLGSRPRCGSGPNPSGGTSRTYPERVPGGANPAALKDGGDAAGALLVNAPRRRGLATPTSSNTSERGEPDGAPSTARTSPAEPHRGEPDGANLRRQLGRREPSPGNLTGAAERSHLVHGP
jgi:hypothetical protein